jgi:hypothetical protein
MRMSSQCAREDDTAPTTDRVREHSPVEANTRVDVETQACLEEIAADREAMSRHLEVLDREWDIERYLQMNAGIVSLAGILLGAAVHKRFLLLPTAVFGFFLQHAVQGWCPPVPAFRAAGVRTRKEINRERYAIKALRDDFARLSTAVHEESRD